MLIRKISIENVRSFLNEEVLLLDGQISIIIGPNGGGKTNLLDSIVIVLRRYLFASMYAAHEPTPDRANRHVFRPNDQLSNMVLDKHSKALDKDQSIIIEIEITSKDIEGMIRMKGEAERLQALSKSKYDQIDYSPTSYWNLENISAGTRVTYKVFNGNIQHDDKEITAWFLQFLKLFEIDGRLREEYELSPLSTPLVYLPVNRAASAFQSSVVLSSFNEYDLKRQNDSASSRTAGQIVSLAIGRLALRYRLLLEKDNRLAADEFRKDPNLVELTRLLDSLGYSWKLETINPSTNQYDVKLTKQGASFLVGSASSGERELLTYLFAIFALNVRDALIIVDEPELHLHPKWQKTLLDLFVKLAESTGNQFVLATHSPTFIAPESIQFVSRVYSQEQRSHVVRMNSAALPESRHLLNVVNSQNNERLFFADEVILVEGLSDRIFFEAILEKFGRFSANKSIIEVVSVGGKGLFKTYEKLLKAARIKYSIVADLDYIEQVGTSEVKSLFRLDKKEIKVDVIENIKSLDADALVSAIDDAISSKAWDEADAIWQYIKSRRRTLRKDLTEDEEKTLKSFLESKRTENLYILGRGAIEAYLPQGYASKDLEKLIGFLASEDFWDKLPLLGRNEIKEIVDGLLGVI